MRARQYNGENKKRGRGGGGYQSIKASFYFGWMGMGYKCMDFFSVEGFGQDEGELVSRIEMTNVKELQNLFV